MTEHPSPLPGVDYGAEGEPDDITAPEANGKAPASVAITTPIELKPPVLVLDPDDPMTSLYLFQ